MDIFRRPLVIVSLIGVFCISFAFMKWQQSRELSAQSPPITSAPTANVESGERTEALPAAPVPQQEPPPPMPRAPAAVPAPAMAVTSAGEETPLPSIPVNVRLRKRLDPLRVEAEVRSNSDKPLPVTLRVMNAGAPGGAEIHLDMSPWEVRTVTTDDGLLMSAHDQLIVSSESFKERVFRLP